MTAYRDRQNAGVYDADKQDAQAQRRAKAKAEKATAKRAANSTTTDKVKGLLGA